VSGRNKRSAAIDFKRPDGLEIVRPLIAEADVVVENFRPGVRERAGLAEVMPDLVMLSVSGYGQRGPCGRRGGFGKSGRRTSPGIHRSHLCIPGTHWQT
jgi:crotonobetainyl-CoA:carnitine CoA-transferase CaiB-like acyl-CoA transferase